MNPFFSQILQGLYVICNICFPLRQSCLDCLVYIHTLDSGNVQAGCFHLAGEPADFLPLPHFACLRAIQCRNHACHAGYLPNLA